MALKALLETLEGIEATVAAHYKEQTGPAGKKEFVLDLEGPTDALPAVKTVKAEAATTRQKMKDFENKYKKLEAFEGMDAIEVRAKLDRIEELELASGGKLDQAAIDKIVEARIKTKLAPIERERDTLKTEKLTLTQQIEQFTTQNRMRSLSDQIREAATKEKMLPEAIEDAVILAERIMNIDEDGHATVKANKAGYTEGLDVVNWMQDVKSKRPHWWGPTLGGGARGGLGGGGAGNNPWSTEHWNMTEQNKMYIADKVKAQKMAEAAGTSIGGKRPAAKK